MEFSDQRQNRNTSISKSLDYLLQYVSFPFRLSLSWCSNEKKSSELLHQLLLLHPSQVDSKFTHFNSTVYQNGTNLQQNSSKCASLKSQLFHLKNLTLSRKLVVWCELIKLKKQTSVGQNQNGQNLRNASSISWSFTVSF